MSQSSEECPPPRDQSRPARGSLQDQILTNIAGSTNVAAGKNIIQNVGETITQNLTVNVFSEDLLLVSRSLHRDEILVLGQERLARVLDNDQSFRKAAETWFHNAAAEVYPLSIKDLIEKSLSTALCVNASIEMLNCFDLSVEIRYELIRYVDYDVYRQNLIAIFTKAFDLREAVQDAETILLECTDFEGLRLELLDLRSREGRQFPRADVEAALTNAIDATRLNDAYSKISLERLNLGTGQAYEFSQLTLEVIIAAAERFDQARVNPAV